MPETTQGATIKKVFLRLMPVLFISYILAYIDRINIGFAAIRMNVVLAFLRIFMALEQVFSFSAISFLRSRAILC